MKARMYWTYATRSLLRGGQRTLLAIFCVAVGVLAIVALQLVNDDIQAGYTANVRAINGADVAVSASDTPFTSTQLSYFDTLQANGAITTYTAVDRVNVRVTVPGATLRFSLLAVDPARFPLAGGVTFADPSNGSVAGALHGDTVVISTTLAQVFDLRVGDTFRFSAQDGRSSDVTVGGIVNSAGLFQGSTMLMERDAYAAIPTPANQPVTYDAIYLDVPGHTDASAANVARQIESRFPLDSVQTTHQLAATAQTRTQTIRYFLEIVALLAVLIGGVGILNTMQVTLRRRRTEIAMLKASGYRARDLYAFFGLEAGLIGLAGGIVGAALGTGASFLVKDLMQSVFEVVFPTTLDVATILSGVAVGFGCALIFGLLPIVQSSQMRPQTMLRDLSGRVGDTSRLLTAALLALLVVLFFALGYSILQNPLVALGAVGGTGAVLTLLGVLFALIVLAIGKLPVPDGFRWNHALLVALALIAGSALALVGQPAFGALFLALAATGTIVALLPRGWKANVKLALRNIGRRRARTAATLTALTIGIFAIGLVLGLGQNVQSVLNSSISSQSVNIAVVASGADRAATERQLAATAGLTHQFVNTVSPDSPVAINGQPVAPIIHAAEATGKYNVNDVTNWMDGVQGYQLAASSTPNATLYPLAQGMQDSHIGRNLSAADAGTTNALLPLWASQAPLNLKLGDTVTVSGSTGNAPVTLTIIGFYRSMFYFEPMQVDNSVVNTLAAGHIEYAYFAYADPSVADKTLAHIQAAIPSVQTFSLSDTLGQFKSILDNITTVLIVIASLAMLAGVLIIANAVALAMLERRRELGILKAVGYTSRGVLSEVLIENGTVGFAGGLVAALLVALVTPLLGNVVFNQVMGVSAPVVLGLVAAAAAVCMLVAGGVAWHSARVRPLEVLRYE